MVGDKEHHREANEEAVVVWQVTGDRDPNQGGGSAGGEKQSGSGHIVR